MQLTEGMQALILAMYQGVGGAGLGVQAISLETGVTCPDIIQVLIGYNVWHQEEDQQRLARQQVIDQAIQMYTANVPIVDIQIELDINPNTLYIELERRGVPKRGHRNLRLEARDRRGQEIIDMYAPINGATGQRDQYMGSPVADIIKAVGVSSNYIYRVLRAEGIPQRRQVRRRNPGVSLLE